MENKITQKIKNFIFKNVTCLACLSKFEIISKNVLYDNLTKLIFKKIIKEKSICVDVGCHRGSILQLMMEIIPNGKFYAFEPLPNLFEYLKQRFKYNKNIELFNIALSDEKGEGSFNYVVSNPGYSGLIKRKYDRPNEEDTTIIVKTDLMDNLLEGIKVDFIKIDVEGAELQVLRGGVKTIKKNKPFIIFEHGLGGADCYGTKPEDVFSLISDCCELQINLLDRYLKNLNPLSKKEFCDQFYRGLNYYFIAYKI